MLDEKLISSVVKIKFTCTVYSKSLFYHCLEYNALNADVSINTMVHKEGYVF